MKTQWTLWVRAAGLLFWLVPMLLQADTFDLVIREGRVLDGTGSPACFADIGIRNGRIAKIGRIPEKAPLELDANGCVIAPGFIDVHTHAEDVDELPRAENFVRMGVTTVIAGNCGSSVLAVGNFQKRLAARNISVNVATLIGHGTVRKKVMGGSFNREPTSEELKEMKALVVRAMKEGAIGFSTGLIYLPGEFAQTEEIIELTKVAAQYDGIYTSHMRSEGTNIFEALNELFRIAREAHIRAQVSHIKLAGKPAWGQADKVLAAITAARESGLDITQDQYVYTASSTGLGQLIPERYKEGDKFREFLQNPSVKSNLLTEMKARLIAAHREDYSYAVIANYKPDKSLNGLNIAEAAKKARGSQSVEDQIELLLDIQKHGGATGIFHGIDEADLQTFLRHPNTMIGSDSGVRRFGDGVPHPRGYGNNARVLARYVRELKLLSLEEAVRRMTSLPATVFRLKDRGCVREGAWADLVVFDPAKVQDESVFNDPHHYATGFRYVLVNGVPVVDHDQHTGAKPGQPLRR